MLPVPALSPAKKAILVVTYRWQYAPYPSQHGDVYPIDPVPAHLILFPLENQLTKGLDPVYPHLDVAVNLLIEDGFLYAARTYGNDNYPNPFNWDLTTGLCLDTEPLWSDENAEVFEATAGVRVSLFIRCNLMEGRDYVWDPYRDFSSLHGAVLCRGCGRFVSVDTKESYGAREQLLCRRCKTDIRPDLYCLPAYSLTPEGRRIAEELVHGETPFDPFAEPDAGANGVRSKSKAAAPATSKSNNCGGRPKLPKPEEHKRLKMVADWQRAKEAGIDQKTFCDDKHIDLKCLQQAINWSAQRRRRGP
jgi:hypothetical protein